MAKVDNLPLLDASILRPILAWLDDCGAEIENHLARARIPGEIVETGGWLSKVQVYRFLAEVVRREACPEIAFAAYSRFQLGDLGPIANSMRSAASVRESLEVFCKLGAASFEGNQFWLADDKDQVWLCNRVVDDAGEGHEYAQHGSLMVLLGIVREYAPHQWRTESVRLQAPHTSALLKVEGFESCEAIFDQDYTAVPMPRKLLGRCPVKEGNDIASRSLIHSGPVDPRTLSGTLERLIVTYLPHVTTLRLADVAVMADISERTIKRRLAEEGTTYRGVLDRIRFRSARRMLDNADLSVATIARELGYSGANNFIRAFKRMAGVTPTEYRQVATSD